MASRAQQRAEAEAARLLELHGLLGEVPIQIERVVRLVKANLQRRPGLTIPGEGEISGMLLRAEGENFIFVNASHNQVRQRFTIAHEIGHLLLHKTPSGKAWIDVNLRGSASSAGTEVQEIEANAFAAALLMPEQEIRLRWELLVPDGRELTVPFGEQEVERVRGLAKVFEVSVDAMTYRLLNLGLAKVMR